MNSQVILVLIFSSVLSCRGGYKIACVFSSMCETHGHKTPKQSPHYKIKWLLMMALPPLCFVEVHRPCQASPSGMISATDTSPIIELLMRWTVLLLWQYFFLFCGHRHYFLHVLSLLLFDLNSCGTDFFIFLSVSTLFQKTC